MNISIWISIIALIISIGAFIHTIISRQSKIKISLSAKRNSLRVDAHEASINLLGLIKQMIKDPQSDQHVRILENMVDTAEGFTWIYKELDKKVKVNWLMQTSIATEYDYISTKIQEFTKMFNRAKTSLESGDLDELESLTEGMHNRILSGTIESDNKIPISETDAEKKLQQDQ